MRVLRLSLVGTVMLVLLGGLGGTVVAQSGAGSDLTGTAGSEPSGTAVYVDGVASYQSGEAIMVIELSMSDPRASGTYTWFHPDGRLYDGQSRPPTEVGYGRVTLANDDGGWSGQQSTLWHDEIGWRVTAWLSGEGSYEGLSLYLHGQRFPVYNTPTMDFDGIIFNGTTPAILEAIQPPAEE
jgi:hypothetical protein